MCNHLYSLSLPFFLMRKMLRYRILGAVGLSMIVSGVSTIFWAWALKESEIGIVGCVITLLGMLILTRKA